MHFGANELQGAAMSVQAAPIPFVPDGNTNPRIQHANYVARTLHPPASTVY